MTIRAPMTGRVAVSAICSRTVPSNAPVVSACWRGIRLGGPGCCDTVAGVAAVGGSCACEVPLQRTARHAETQTQTRTVKSLEYKRMRLGRRDDNGRKVSVK
jgi:hypothetical protein